MWLTFDTEIYYTHKLKPSEWVTDKKCLVSHPHDDVHIHVEVERLEEHPIDFKKIRDIVMMVLNPYIGKDISETADIFTTEEFARRIQVNIQQCLGIPRRKVRLHLQETTKYGVTIDG